MVNKVGYNAPTGSVRNPPMIYITHIRMSTGGSRSEHITDVRWNKPSTGETEDSTTAEMVRWIDAGGDACVKSAAGDVQVGTVNATPKHLRTYADGRETNNLLELPRF